MYLSSYASSRSMAEVESLELYPNSVVVHRLPVMLPTRCGHVGPTVDNLHSRSNKKTKIENKISPLFGFRIRIKRRSILSVKKREMSTWITNIMEKGETGRVEDVGKETHGHMSRSNEVLTFFHPLGFCFSTLPFTRLTAELRIRYLLQMYEPV